MHTTRQLVLAQDTHSRFALELLILVASEVRYPLTGQHDLSMEKVTLMNDP